MNWILALRHVQVVRKLRFISENLFLSIAQILASASRFDWEKYPKLWLSSVRGTETAIVHFERFLDLAFCQSCCRRLRRLAARCQPFLRQQLLHINLDRPQA